MACLHRTYVGGVERGERNVSLVNIWRIADALEINPSVLFAGPREPILAETPRRISSTALVGKDVPRKDRLWTKSRKQ